MHDGRDAFLAAAIGPGDKHRHRRARDLAGQLQRARHGVGRKHHAAQIETLRQRLLPRTLLTLELRHLA